MINFLNRLKKNAGTRLKESGVSGICSGETFKFLLKRERARADRGCVVFSLVIFDLRQGRKNASGRRLIKTLKERIRITDSIGRMGNSSVGVLLADAPDAGGHAFLRDVLRSVPDIRPAPECRVYTYPAASGEEVFNEMLALNPSSWRRLAERFTAAFVLLLLSPLMILIAFAVKLASPGGPALYSQLRVGHKGKAFRCFKFRTMHPDADTSVHEDYFKTLIVTNRPMRKLDGQEDTRIFKLGRLLRSSSLDELPQLFNILKGEMSLIGPRPAIPGEYRNYLPWHRRRVDVPPGLTGLWQVSGKNKTTFSEMMRFDVRYARRKSLWTDIRIVFRTIPVIFSQFIEEHRFNRSVPHRAPGAGKTACLWKTCYSGKCNCFRRERIHEPSSEL